MIEVEIKIPVPDASEMILRLTSLGFLPESTVAEEDSYYDNEAGQIRGGHQALRIRRITDHDTGKKLTQVTFKDRKMDTVSMTRPEYETEVTDGDAMEKILRGLGYAPVEPTVRKLRRSYRMDPITACVDQVEGLGSFLELESVIDESENREEALQRIAVTLQELGLRMEDSTRTSYLSQLQKKKGIL